MNTTLSIIKADVGSIGGHIAPSKHLLESRRRTEFGRLLSGRVTEQVFRFAPLPGCTNEGVLRKNVVLSRFRHFRASRSSRVTGPGKRPPLDVPCLNARVCTC